MTDIAATVTKQWMYAPAGPLLFVGFSVAIAAGDYAAGGVAIKAGVDALVPNSKDPLVGSMNLYGVTGYLYKYVDSTGKMTIWDTIDPADSGGLKYALQEHAVAAVSSTITDDTIYGMAIYRKA